MSPVIERWLRRGALSISVALAASLVATATIVIWPRVSRSVGIKPAPPLPRTALARELTRRRNGRRRRQ